VLLAAGVEIGTAANDNIELSKMIGYAFFALALILAAFAFGYTLFFIRRLKKRREGEEEKDRVEEVIKILKETKRIKEEIERRGENLTSEADITIAQILSSLDYLKIRALTGRASDICMSDLRCKMDCFKLFHI
jgi:hypothetical protein